MIHKLCTRCCVLLTAWLAISFSASGQITLGAKTGLNLNQFSQPGTTVGANVGVYGSYTVLPFLTARVEPHYSQEGGGRPDYTRYYNDISDNISNITFVNPSVTFHTIQIPVFAELTLPEFQEEAIRPKLMLGVSYAMVVSSMEQHIKRYSFTDDGSLPNSDPLPRLDVAYERENVTDNYARNQWSAWLGMGLEFEAGERTFSFDVRYRQGLRNLNQMRFASPGIFTSNGFLGVPGTGGNLFSSSVSFNFSMSLFNF